MDTGVLNLVEISAEDSRSSHEDDIPSVSNRIHVPPNCFPHQTPGPIALNRLTNPATGREAKATVGKFIGQNT